MDLKPLPNLTWYLNLQSMLGKKNHDEIHVSVWKSFIMRYNQVVFEDAEMFSGFFF